MAKKTDMELAQDLIAFAYDIIRNSDDTGCDGDLTVTSKSSVKKMEKVLEAIKKRGHIVENK